MKNFKKKLAARGGFTLVELIVVIAILAILAGVGTAAYSGYVKKAYEANDTQLLSAANTAFAAACVENGVQPSEVTCANITGTTITAIDVTAVGTLANPALAAKCTAIENSFLTYFAGNTSTALQYYTGFTFNTDTHNFKGTAPTT